MPEDDRGRIVYDRVRGEFYLARDEVTSLNKKSNQGFLEFWDMVPERKQVEHGFRNLTLILTQKCNLSCDYCWQSHTDPESLELDTIEKWLTYFLNQEIHVPKKIVYYGGEPLLEKDLMVSAIDIIKRIVSESRILPPRQHVFTNGTLFTKSLIDVFRRENIFPIISIDGCQDLNDKHRLTRTGKSLWRNIMSGISMLHNAEVSFGIACTVEEPEFNFFQVAGFLVESIQPDTIEFNLRHDAAMVTKYNRNPNPDFSSFWRAWDLSLDHGITVVELRKRVKPYIQRKPLGNSSSGSKNKLSVMPNGKISPFNGAVSAPALQVSDSRPYWQEFFKEIWRREIRTRPDCQSCEAIFICGQGSAFTSYLQFGDFDHVPVYHCEYCRSVLAYIKQRLQKHISFDNPSQYSKAITPRDICQVFQVEYDSNYDRGELLG
jgi:uncharacterized protein